MTITEVILVVLAITAMAATSNAFNDYARWQRADHRVLSRLGFLCRPACGQVFGIGICVVLLMVGNAANARNMVLEGLDGDVTTNEYKSFIDKLNALPPPPSNNIGNTMVYERDGARLHGMQTFYSFTHDRRVLDLAIVWSDAFLHGRNDPVNGRVVWTGKRELCWPNKETNNVAHVLYSGAENGDVIEHIVNTARLILENPALWPETAPPDTYGYGATYLDRAKTYVRECQRSAETTIVSWYVRSTKDGYRLIHPDSRDYWKYCESSGPVPWNQQQCVVGGLLRLAQCHRLLHDGNPNVNYYEQITRDAADWFFPPACSSARREESVTTGRMCLRWIQPRILKTPATRITMFMFFGPTRRISGRPVCKCNVSSIRRVL